MALSSVIPISLLVLAAAAGALAMPPCVCTRELNPVCGTDRQSYSNPCELDCAKSKQASSNGPALAVAHFGPCEEVALRSRMSAPAACPCPRIFLPVCGTDTRTYVNPCELDCAKTKGLSPKGDALAVAHNGPCEEVAVQSLTLDPAPIVCPCPRIFAPVCGTDARTYGNKCELNCAKKHGASAKGDALAVAHDGACDEVLTRSAVPATIVYLCPRINAPVCGTDSRTYGNRCQLHLAGARGLSPKGSALAVAYVGPCYAAPADEAQKADLGLLRCVLMWEPVCGNDGRTYDNLCMLNGAKARGQSSKGDALAVAHSGPCEETSAGIQLLSNEQVQPLPKACLCPFIFKPVCGTDSVTYPSECTLGCSRDMGTSTKGVDLKVAHSGAC